MECSSKSVTRRCVGLNCDDKSCNTGEEVSQFIFSNLFFSTYSNFMKSVVHSFTALAMSPFWKI